MCANLYNNGNKAVLNKKIAICFVGNDYSESNAWTVNCDPYTILKIPIMISPK